MAEAGGQIPNCTESTVKGAILLDGWPVKNHKYDVITVLKIGSMVLKIEEIFSKIVKKIFGPVDKSGK